MRKIIKTAVAAALLTAGTIGATAPAEARGWHGGGYHGGYGYHGGHYGHRGYGTGAAVGLGLLGLGVGAAIASDRYYDSGYYAAPPAYGYYAPPPAYYAPPPPPPAYGYGYYGY